MRNTELPACSRETARPTCDCLTTSLIIARRTGNSVAATSPMTKLRVAKCQYRRESLITRVASRPETQLCNTNPTIIMYFRLIRSATMPKPKPNNMGIHRKKNTSETRNGDPVRSSATKANKSISSHIVVPVIHPTAQSRTNWGFRIRLVSAPALIALCWLLMFNVQWDTIKNH